MGTSLTILPASDAKTALSNLSIGLWFPRGMGLYEGSVRISLRLMLFYDGRVTVLSFIAPCVKDSWYPTPGERVVGVAGKRTVEGIVVESAKNPRKPAIFSTRGGYVGLYILLDNGKRVAVDHVRPVSVCTQNFTRSH